MGKSSRAFPRLSLDEAHSSSGGGTAWTSRVRAARSTATSRTQDDEDDDDYEIVEKPAEAKKASGGTVKWLRKAVKRVVGLGKISSSYSSYATLGGEKAKSSSEQSGDENSYLEEPVDVEEGFLKDREGMQARYGGVGAENEGDPFGDENEVESEGVSEGCGGSCWKGVQTSVLRDRFIGRCEVYDV